MSVILKTVSAQRHPGESAMRVPPYAACADAAIHANDMVRLRLTAFCEHLIARCAELSSPNELVLNSVVPALFCQENIAVSVSTQESFARSGVNIVVKQ